LFLQFLNFGDNLGGIWGVGVFPGNDDCHSLWGCFKFVLCYGVRQGGGVGDVMNLAIDTQWLADLFYFLIVIIMLLNIVFGIIIDTFSSLRAEKIAKLENTLEVCFICSIEKQTFDRASDEPDGFKTHIKLDHNMWNYMYYIFMLWEQDRDDDDGLEQYVRRAIDADEIVWFPLRKAIRLDQAATEEEETLKEISEKFDKFERILTHKLSAFQSDVSSFVDQISNATRQSFEDGTVKSGIAKFLREYSVKEAVLEEGIDMASEVALLDDDGNFDDALAKGEQQEEEEGEEEHETQDADTPDGTQSPEFRPSWIEKGESSVRFRTSPNRARLDSNMSDFSANSH
jgi:hypothetical protein